MARASNPTCPSAAGGVSEASLGGHARRCGRTRVDARGQRGEPACGQELQCMRARASYRCEAPAQLDERPRVLVLIEGAEAVGRRGRAREGLWGLWGLRYHRRQTDILAGQRRLGRCQRLLHLVDEPEPLRRPRRFLRLQLALGSEGGSGSRGCGARSVERLRDGGTPVTREECGGALWCDARVQVDTADRAGWDGGVERWACSATPERQRRTR